MEKRFAIRTHDVATLVNAYSIIMADEGQKKRIARRRLFISLGCMAAGALLCVFPGIWAKAPGLGTAGMFAFIFGLMMTVISLDANRKARIYANRPKNTVYSFDEEGVIILDGGETERFGYADFIKLHEDAHCFILHTGGTNACYLPKADFVQGNPAEFAAFISQKTGLTMKPMRGRKTYE